MLLFTAVGQNVTFLLLLLNGEIFARNKKKYITP